MIHITYDTDDNEVKEKTDPLAVNLKMCPFKMDSIRMGGRGLLICSPRNEKKKPRTTDANQKSNKNNCTLGIYNNLDVRTY